MNDQYEYAIKLAGAVKTKYGNKNGENIELAGGHSLGGGLATAAAIVHSLPATVFNPAGVHPATVARHNGDITKIAKPIVAYRIKGEFLTSLQDANGTYWYFGPPNWTPTPVPMPGNALPDTVATRIVTLYSKLPPWKPLTKHFMDTVIDALKNADPYKP